VAAPPTGKLTVYVVNYPLQYFTQRIGGDAVNVRFPGPADEDPAYWEPDADTVAAYQKADLILLNGATYAKWVARATLPQARIVDTSAAVRDRYVELQEEVVHAHGPEGAHEHTGYAFTTWLDPTIAIEQARAVKDALSRRRPDLAAQFEAAFAALETELTDLDTRLEEIVAGSPGLPLVMSHPVYQYMERRYGLNARSVHWEPDQEPSPAMWDDLRALIREHPARWMIWEGEPAEQTVAALLEAGIDSTVFDPCGSMPEQGDYLEAMDRNVTNLERVFAP
jgi:zinc transport system substrate-binding protein